MSSKPVPSRRRDPQGPFTPAVTPTAGPARTSNGPGPGLPAGTSGNLVVRRLGCRDYLPTWTAMQELTLSRRVHDPDEIWLLEHPPVFTLGRNGKAQHVLSPGAIPVVRTDRGGQVTYHGPGQLVVYPLLDLRRLGLGVRRFVTLLEESVIGLLASYGIRARGEAGAPGVYAGAAKIASVGLRIRNGCSYHGLSLNVAMDLEPFSRINPCGYPGMAVTQVADEGGPGRIGQVADALAERLLAAFGGTPAQREAGRGDEAAAPPTARVPAAGH